MQCSRMGLLVLGTTALLSTSGCGRPADAPEAQLTREIVIGIAETKARQEGLDTAKYNMTGCHYQFTRKDRTWTVFYDLKPPTPPGGHFMVIIDDRTKQATLVRGK